MAGYSDLRRTIAGALSSGNKDKAKKYAADSWDSLDAKQKNELTRLGVAPSLPSNGYNSDLIYGGAGKIVGGSKIPSVSDVFGPNSGNYDKWANTKAGSIVNNAISTTPTTKNGTKTTQTVTMPTSVGDLPTYNSEYMDQLNALARQLTSMNYDDWTKGSQYQALAERYGASGRMSMQDVLGQVASRTGGLASSYATTAAQQQYNQYMAQLEEVARQLYSQERGDLMDSASLYRNLANDEYDRYRDSLSDYNARLKAAQSAARSVYGGTSYNSGNNYSFVSATRPKIGRESASETGSTSFSNIKRTISGKLAGGDVEGASRLVESVWDDLSNKQKQDIKKMGFSVS